MPLSPVARHTRAAATAALLCTAVASASTAQLPIADAHVHYSHDSVELTPPARVIELMREANLKFALVSSSDDRGTQLLSALAPDLIVPGLRPYTRRGELSSWLTNEKNLRYVEALLARNRYATIGEFHLYGSDADQPIPRRIVELAVEHNLVLHAHSDADAVERLLAQDPTVKVLWAHAGFDEPEEIGAMLAKHDRLWADLAFRGDVSYGGELSEEWVTLFTTHPDRIMLGTDTYTPERMYFLPSHAEESRLWLSNLPADLAARVAWRNAYDLLMPHWEANRAATAAESVCEPHSGDATEVAIRAVEPIVVSQAFSALVTVCHADLDITNVALDARMPAHGHGMNYAPTHTVTQQTANTYEVQVDGLVLHMPGDWQWQIDVRSDAGRMRITRDFSVN
ncbi:MAG: amidohydrolase family protein [Pseudomonadota bacterium]